MHAGIMQQPVRQWGKGIRDVYKRQIYTWVNIGGLIAIFLAPISGLLINSFTVIPVIRVLYLVFSVNMLIKVAVTFRYCKETRQGKIRMAETKDTSLLHMLYEYKELIPKVLKDKEVMKVLAVSVILYITNMVSTNFFSLYVTQWLGIESRYLAFFPILNAAVMLIFMIGIQHKLELCLLYTSSEPPKTGRLYMFVRIKPDDVSSMYPSAVFAGRASMR